MPSPLVGITMSITVDARPERVYLNTAYLLAVQEAGGVPVLLPPHLNEPARTVLWRSLDGVVLTGGGDVDPALFNEPRHESVSGVSRARDTLEIDLVHWSLQHERPLLAICRGIQVLNVALGGSLHQDVPGHAQTTPRDVPSHKVRLSEGSCLHAIIGVAALDVNSFHHQSIKTVAKDLRAVAWAPDGVVEGVEMARDRGFLVGVEWHPEELRQQAASRNLFRALVAAAAASKART